jgi:hypothetical protein
MPAATEESREKVEGIVVVPTSALRSLFEAFMSVLVVDFAGLGVGKSFVGFGYFDEFLLGSCISADSLLV